MSERLHELCRDRSDYREFFERRFGVHQREREPPPLVECVHRGPSIGSLATPFESELAYDCAVHRIAHGSACDRCEDRETSRTSRSFREILGAPAKGERVRKWSVGVTTAPRKEPTIARSLRSLRNAGFTPRIFAEPDSVIPDEAEGLPITYRSDRLGAWPNTYLALHEMLLRDPDADAFVLVQDDVIFCERDDSGTLREYLEEALWPAEEVGAVSLYTSLAYATDERGWIRFDDRAGPKGKRSWVWGACCLIWSRESLAHFLAHNGLRWRLDGPFKNPDDRNPLTRGTRNIDTCVGKWASQHGRAIYYPSPSLAQHVGNTSAIFATQTATGKRKARDFLGDLWGVTQ